MKTVKPAKTLAEALARAREMSPRLSAATDELNRAIVSAEQAIAALQLGVRASVVMLSGPDTNPWYTKLTFGKDGKAWRLFIEDGHELHSEHDETTPLTNASREQRLHAVSLLPDLVQALILAVETEIQRVEESTATIKGFVTSIKGEGRG